MFLKKVSLLIVFIFIFSIVSSLSAEEVNRTGFKGISTAIQSNQLDIMVPIWTNQQLVLVPSVSFSSISDNSTDLGLGLLVRINIRSDDIVPYIGFRGGVLMYNPQSGDTKTDKVFGVAFGCEYFIRDHFSLGIESQLNLSLSDDFSYRFGNPGGKNLNTASIFFATIYF